MFLDEKELLVRAGKGGDGAILFRREIYVPHGGPDGGDGGRGGDVWAVARHNLHTLSHLSAIDRIVAENGLPGGHRTSTGKSGQPVEIHVPLGTVIYKKKEDQEEWEELIELVEEGQKVMLVKGGNGGWGNWHFKSSIQQAPERANPGQAGGQLQIRLVLKLIADVGLVGLPNAGKSTFLSVVSAARPKIANYPFTTLEPQLGVAEIGNSKERRQLVIADLPGLIEGASQGKGLGDAFLKHIERTKSIIHFLDGSLPVDEIVKNYTVIRQELSDWSQSLSSKSEVVALNKCDLYQEDALKALLKELKKRLKLSEIYPISAASHQGVQELLQAVAK